jgi:hypothetical protein
MEMFNTKTEEFLGFTFNGQHSSDFNLVVVSDGSRYHSPLFGAFTDTVLKVPGRNGTYYFGSEFESKTLSINLAFDNLTGEQFSNMKNWLSNQNVGKLILNEEPYKYYWAKLASQPIMDFVPFDATYILANAVINTILYKGELTLEFIAYDPFGYQEKSLTVDSYFSGANLNLPPWFLESGLLPSTYHHNGILFSGDTLSSLTANAIFYIYNGGNTPSDCIISFDVAPFTTDLELVNEYSNDTIIITPFTIDFLTVVNSLVPSGQSSTISKFGITVDGVNKNIQVVGKNNVGTIITNSTNLGKYHNNIFLKVHPINSAKLIKLNKDEEYAYDLMIGGNTTNYNPSDYSGSAAIVLPDYNDYFCCTLVDCKLMSTYLAYIDANTPQSNEINKISFLIKPNGFSCNKALTNVEIDYSYKYL